MENLKKILDWLKPKPLWTKIVAIVFVVALCVLLLCSCGTLSATIPKSQNNEIGAEGVVSKEKNVTKTTKWFYLPDSQQNPN